jgi:hypothetical protein
VGRTASYPDAWFLGPGFTRGQKLGNLLAKPQQVDLLLKDLVEAGKARPMMKAATNSARYPRLSGTSKLSAQAEKLVVAI